MSVVESAFSFDFDYNEYGPEDDGTRSAHPASAPRSLFGFGYDFPLDAEGDVIYPDERLDEKTVQMCMSTVGPIINTFKHAYTKLKARKKRLVDIEILSRFIHLRNVDLADNRLRDLAALLPLTYLQVLNVEGNQITDVAIIPKFLYLQALNLARNDISSTLGFQPNKLAFLNLSKNRLNKLDDLTGEVFPNLLVLELRENQLGTLEGLELPKLEQLYLAANQLEDLKGLEQCPNLKIIHARHNQISTLDNFPAFKQLEYLNLRNNKISQLTQTLEIGNAKTLKKLSLKENPVANESNYRVETIAVCSPSLQTLDKEDCTEIERVNALRLRAVREKNLKDAAEVPNSGLLDSRKQSVSSSRDGQQ